MIVKELFMKLGIQSDSKDFKKAEGGMERITDFAKKAAVAFASFKLGQWVKGVTQEVAELSDKFDKMSKRIGLSTKFLQEWSFVSDLAGTSIGEMEVAVRRLQLSVDQANLGSKTAQEGFKRLGIETRTAAGAYKTAEQLLPELADGFANLTDSTLKTALAQQLLGRSGTSLIPIFEQGSEAILEQRKEMEDLGAVMDESLISFGADYIDNQTRLGRAWLGIKNVIGKQLLPVFNEMSKNSIEWFKQNRKWIALKLGSIFKSLGRVIKNISRFFEDIIDNVIDWAKELVPLQKGILKISAAAAGLAILLALPAGSILLLIGLIVLLIDDFQTWQEGGESVIGSLIEKMEKFLGLDVIRIVKGWGSSFVAMVKRMFAPLIIFIKFITDIFILGLPKAWQRFNTRLIDLWNAAVNRIFGFFQSLQDGIIKIFKFLWNIISSGVKNFLSGLWTGFKETLDKLWIKIVEWSNKIVDKISAPFRKVKELVSGIFGDDEKVAQKIQSASQMAQGEPLLTRTVSEPTRRFVSPTSNNSVNVTVNATPGMDEKKLAKKVSQGVHKELEKINRATIQAFVPAGG